MRIRLEDLAPSHRAGRAVGITSVCSAHPLVIRAAARNAGRHGSTMLIEATCNQVNQFGGYTGMQPTDFVALVQGIAADEGLAPDAVVLGGDHLGPNPWRAEPVEAAMAKAEAMVAAYVAAGFTKLHLDASMGCAGEPAALDDRAIATRAARLAQAAENAAVIAGTTPVYVIGTEVPPPGGADHALSAIEPTSAAAARHTIAVHREVFANCGLGQAFCRVIGVVVQPGVEFGNTNVVRYDRAKAQPLTEVLEGASGIVFEAHSTDYQGRAALRQLVAGGFAILKVGPELTFVLREALYGLDRIASDLDPSYGRRPLFALMEDLMVAEPSFWTGHYRGTEAEQRVARHTSLSDRIRYYWPRPEAQGAVDRVVRALQGRDVPPTLFHEHLPALEHFAGARLDPVAVLVAAVERSLDDYAFACRRP